MIPRDLVGDLIATLEQLRQILPSDKATWDSEIEVCLAVERLWITAGNLAETYRMAAGIETGIDPWAELAGYRKLLAHACSETSLPIGCSPTAPPTSTGSSARSGRTPPDRPAGVPGLDHSGAAT